MFDKIITKSLEYSVQKGKFTLSRTLVYIYNRFNIPIDPDIFNNIQYNGQNVINEAISNGNHLAVRTFLNNGAKLNLDVSKSVSCLNIAINSENLELLSVLLNHIYCRCNMKKTSYDKNLASLLTACDSTKKPPIITACDLFLHSNDTHQKNFSKKCIELIYNNPLFDKNNSQFFNAQWKRNSHYFLDYNQPILNTIENYVLESKNPELINFFTENGLIYVDKSILCVNPSLYSHSAIILKFNRPITFKDSVSDVAGILYSFEFKDKTNNSKKSFLDKHLHSFEQISSFVTNRNAYMKRILLTSLDIVNMRANHGDNIFSLSYISGANVALEVSSAFKTITSLRKTPSFSNVKLNSLLKRLTSNMENIAYLFSLYTHDAYNFVAHDKIIDYNFDNGKANITIDDTSNLGYLIYDFIWTTLEVLDLSHSQKLSVIEEFLNLECLKVLKQNKIIEKDCTTFDINSFDKLPVVRPNDLYDKFYYPKTMTFDFSINPSNNTKRDAANTALCGHKMNYLMEQFNINTQYYSFLNNNCITTLKHALSECGYKNQIENADKTLNICQKRHPLSVITKLQNMLNIKRDIHSLVRKL